MLISREFIGYVSRELVKRLTPQTFEVTDPNGAVQIICEVVENDLAVEDRLNEEVREILSQYSDYMRREGVSYQEMFRKIKKKLIVEHKVVRAAGRDTGDPMKLSRDKVNDLSHKLIASMQKSRAFRLKGDSNDIRLEIVREFTEVLMIEDRVDRSAREKVQSHKREIPEGSEEYDLLHRKYYADELKKLGIDFSA